MSLLISKISSRLFHKNVGTYVWYKAWVPEKGKLWTVVFITRVDFVTRITRIVNISEMKKTVKNQKKVE